MVGWHHGLNEYEFKRTPGDSEGPGSLACCSSWGRKESDTTEQLNNNKGMSADISFGSFPAKGIRGEKSCEEKNCAGEKLEYFQISSVAQAYATLFDPMNCSTPGLPVHHQLPEFTQTHVHRVSDAIHLISSKGMSSPLPPAPNPS